MQRADTKANLWVNTPQVLLAASRDQPQQRGLLPGAACRRAPGSMASTSPCGPLTRFTATVLPVESSTPTKTCEYLPLPIRLCSCSQDGHRRSSFYAEDLGSGLNSPGFPGTLEPYLVVQKGALKA